MVDQDFQQVLERSLRVFQLRLVEISRVSTYVGDAQERPLLLRHEDLSLRDLGGARPLSVG